MDVPSAQRAWASGQGRGGGCGWWERPPAAICRRVAREARLIDDLQRLPRLPILTDDAEVSRRQEVIMSPGRPFQLTAHEASYLELALRTGSTLATFDTQLADAMRQVSGRAQA
jgi:predicted nucleic acid-binding protein